MLSSELQPANALSPIDVTLSGTVICLNPQLWNAALSIAVSTLSSPKFTSRREVQPLNAPVPKEASLLPSPKSAAVKAVQPLNALPSIAVSSFENFTFASEEQPLNALPPILAEFKFTAVIESATVKRVFGYRRGTRYGNGFQCGGYCRAVLRIACRAEKIAEV